MKKVFETPTGASPKKLVELLLDADEEAEVSVDPPRPGESDEHFIKRRIRRAAAGLAASYRADHKK